MAEFENSPTQKGRNVETAFSIRFLSFGKADSWRERQKRVT